MSSLELVSSGGARLAASLFEPGGAARGAVLIGPATGIPAAYYAPLASWLAAQGYRVLCADYRGIGASRPPAFRRSLRGFRASLSDWIDDLDCALRALAERSPDLPLTLLGHSLGGQLLPLLPSAARVQALLGVAVGSGYWGDVPPAIRSKARWLWRALVPLVLPLWGYFPGARLGFIGDLPAQAMRDWRRWCLQPRYLLDDPGVSERYAAMRQAVVSLHMADDEMVSERSLRLLFDAYVGSRARHFELLHPLPGQRIGHSGFFRAQHRETHWPRLLHHLNALNQEVP